jgi:hypothetical protein
VPADKSPVGSRSGDRPIAAGRGRIVIDTLAIQEALGGREASVPWPGVQAKRSASVVQLLRAHDVAVTAVARGRADAVVAEFPDLEQCGGLARSTNAGRNVAGQDLRAPFGLCPGAPQPTDPTTNTAEPMIGQRGKR